jgi:hypothetical protein
MTHTLPGKNLKLLHSENGFYATLTAQADADSNQQTASQESNTLPIAPQGSVKHFQTQQFHSPFDIDYDKTSHRKIEKGFRAEIGPKRDVAEVT